MSEKKGTKTLQTLSDYQNDEYVQMMIAKAVEEKDAISLAEAEKFGIIAAQEEAQAVQEQAVAKSTTKKGGEDK